MTYSIAGRADIVFNQFYEPYGYILQNIEFTALQEIGYDPSISPQSKFLCINKMQISNLYICDMYLYCM